MDVHPECHVPPLDDDNCEVTDGCEILQQLIDLGKFHHDRALGIMVNKVYRDIIPKWP